MPEPPVPESMSTSFTRLLRLLGETPHPFTEVGRMSGKRWVTKLGGFLDSVAEPFISEGELPDIDPKNKSVDRGAPQRRLTIGFHAVTLSYALQYLSLGNYEFAGWTALTGLLTPKFYPMIHKLIHGQR